MATSRDERIDVICDAFEERWLSGERPDIADFLPEEADDFSSQLFAELLLVDAEYRAQHGDDVSKADYLRRFPRYAAEVETVSGRLSWTITPAAKKQPTFEPGALFLDRFVMGECLGAGAAGEVWKARDTRLQRTVAVKIPNSRIVAPDEVHRFVREGRSAAQLRHSNIVAVHEASQQGETAYIISDFIDGRNLRQHLAENRLHPRAAAKLCATIGRALHYAHQQGVVHRDLKPANIILDGAGVPHVTDFGLAKWSGDAQDLTVAGQVLGTPAYMSPEQARGESAAVDRRADVYALGVVLYELLTGRCPFAGGQAAVIHQIATAEAVRPRYYDRQIPRDLETICRKALEKEADRRYATAEELADDLERYLKGEPIQARPAGLAETVWRFFKRRPATAVALLLTAAVIALSLMASSMARTNHRLLGLQTVSLTTEPPGADAALVRLSDVDGRPEAASPDEVVRGRTPLVVDLPPGNYLVVAALADGRFHEVMRHVPRDATSIPGAYNHLFWKEADDGLIELPKITIPSLAVTKDMALVVPEATTRRPREDFAAAKKVQPFYVDAEEFTYGDYKERFHENGWDKSMADDPPPDTDWLPRDLHRATYIAELTGKRLPTREEYAAFAISAARARVAAVADENEPSILTVDLTPTVPEWTNSWILNDKAIDRAEQLQEFAPLMQFRLVCGAPLAGAPIHRHAYGDDVSTCVAHRSATGVGFRGVRSARPRYMAR